MGSEVLSELTLRSGLCLRKDEILLWVFSGFLVMEGPADSKECEEAYVFPPVSSQVL